MRYRSVIGIVVAIVAGVPMLALAQDQAQNAAATARPVPRWPDGRVRLGALPGEAGIWVPANGGSERMVNPDDFDPTTAAQFAGRPRESEIPFQHWARELFNFRRANPFDPHTRCKASGGPRQFLTPYGTEIVEIPELQRIYILDIGGPHTYRIIYMDGRQHPEDLSPSYYGHHIGHWEGDTLVVDSIGYNEKFWFGRRPMPNTERLHLIERFTRTDFNTIEYEVTVDDPGAYTAIWSAGISLRWDEGSELFEFICQDNNFAPELMIGTFEEVDRSSRIVP